MHNLKNGIVPVHTPLTWAIFGTLTVSLLLLLILSIVILIYIYRKNKREFLTVYKIGYMSILLSIFLLQSFIMAPFLKLPIPFSFNSITTVTVGFIFGPLEGILFGWIADSLNTLINGWTYQILPSLLYPIIGLSAGIAGFIYNKEIKNSKVMNIIIFQIMAFTLIILVAPGIYGLLKMGDKINNSPWSSGSSLDPAYIYGTISFAVVTLILIEATFAYILFFNKGKNLFLFTLLLAVAFVDRGFELLVTPFNQYFTGYELNYSVALITRMISTTYLIPTVAITSFFLIRGTQIAMEVK